ncbi:MAG: hypothetical protein KGZ25_08180 [Planctomycetes bacterium]|nr:hypothetical protein [Planctomycetota bacterium]
MPVISFCSADTYNKRQSDGEKGTDAHQKASDTSGPPLEHNKNIMKDPPDDLKEIIQAWPELPSHVRVTILTLIRNGQK